MITKQRSATEPDIQDHEYATHHFPEVTDVVVSDVAQTFKLLAEPTRLKILVLLAQQGELHVRALCDELGQSQPAVSHHLALLRAAGMLVCRRDGKHNYYRVMPQQFQALLHRVFGAIPAADRQFRLNDYVLSYAPISTVPH